MRVIGPCKEESRGTICDTSSYVIAMILGENNSIIFDLRTMFSKHQRTTSL